MSPLKRWVMSIFLPIGGIIHGIFASGGPLVVIYSARAISEKTIFRVTMCMMWFTMNTAMITQWALGKADHVHVLKIVAFLLPWTMVGLWIGNRAHYRVNENTFRKVVYAVLHSIWRGSGLVAERDSNRSNPAQLVHASAGTLTRKGNAMVKLGVIFLGRKRPGFDPEWGKQMEQAVRAALAKSDYDVVIRNDYVVDDASLRHALAQMRADSVNVLAVLQPTMSDGRFAPVLSQVWGDPLVLWATPEKQDYSMISACSLVGLHTFASTLRQLRKPFEIVYGMPGEAETMKQLDRAVMVAYAASQIKKGKVGLIGYHAPGFIDMQADPFQMSTGLGLELWHTGLKDLVDRMNEMPEDRVRADVAKAMAMGMPLDDVTEADVAVDCRCYLAMSDIIDEESLDVLALRDWGELPNLTGQWPYLAMVRMLTSGFPVACEGDTDGGITLLIGRLLGLEAGYLSDWLEHDHETVTLWHAGNGSLNLCDPVGYPKGSEARKAL